MTVTQDDQAAADLAAIERIQGDVFSTQRPEGGWSRFDRDPETLAWAREKVSAVLDKMGGYAERAGDEKALAIYEMMRRALVDGRKTVFVASFDDRKPGMIERAETAAAEAGR
jgi:hypothetical protein